MFKLVLPLLFSLRVVVATPQAPPRIAEFLATHVSASARSPTAQRPFTAEDALRVRTFANLTRPALSPDGKWLAYTVRDNGQRETSNDARNRFFTPTGAPSSVVNCDIWLTDTKTGESRNLTEGQGTNWDPVWSPNGKYLAFYSDRGGVARLWLWDRDSGQSRQLSDATARSSYTALVVVRWMPDSRQIVAKVLPAGMTLERAADLINAPPPGAVLADPSDGATVTVYRSPLAEPAGKLTASSSVESGPSINRYLGDLAVINVANGGIVRVVQDVRPANFWLSPDGKYLAYLDAKGIRQNTDQLVFDLGLYSFAQHSSRTLVPGIEQGFGGMAVSWSPDARSLAYITDAGLHDSGASGAARGDCFVVSVDGSKPRNLTKGVHPPFESGISAPLWDLKGHSIYLVVSKSSLVIDLINSDINAIWKASVGEGTATEVARIPGHAVLGLLAASGAAEIWSPDGGRSIVVGTQDETTRQAGFWQVELSSGKVNKLFEDRIAFSFPEYFALSTDAARDGRTVTYVSEDAQHPQDIWIAGSDFNDRRRLTNINPELTDISFGASRTIEYHSLDGIPLHGALLLPAGYQEGKRYPMIAWLYSGSFMSREVYRFGLESSILASLNLQILASHGYAVLVADAPLNTGTPVLDLVKTVMPAVDRVVNMGIADPFRLGVMGHSYGGYLTAALIEQTSRFKVAVAYAGIYDLIAYYGHMGPGGSSAASWAESGQGRIGGTPWQFRDRYVENSPIFYLDHIQIPLLIVHGELDPIPCQQAEEAFVGLRRLGKEVVYAKYAREGHVLKSRANVADFWNRVIFWFDKHLKADAPQRVPSPSSPGNPR